MYSTPHAQNTKKVYVKRIDDRAVLPNCCNSDSTGMYLYSLCDITLKPFCQSLINTGIIVQTPSGIYGRIEPVQNMTVNGVHVNCPPIQPGFTDAITILLSNMSNNIVQIDKNSAIAQLVLMNQTSCEFVISDVSSRDTFWNDELVS